MPDLLTILIRKWKFIFGLSFLSAIIALIVALIIPKKYLATATALPANTVLSDKASILNQNIEALYSDFGSTDDLDRIEGTATLDTIFIATSKEFNLPQHYSIRSSNDVFYTAALQLKKNSKINRSAYGELKVKVWDEDKNMAAALANALMQKLQQIHQSLLNTINVTTAAGLKENYAAQQHQYLQLTDSLHKMKEDSLSGTKQIIKMKLAALADQLQQYQKSIDQYELAIGKTTPVLLIVENARPPQKADKQDVLPLVIFVFAAAFILSFLVMLFVETRNFLS